MRKRLACIMLKNAAQRARVFKGQKKVENDPCNAATIRRLKMLTGIAAVGMKRRHGIARPSCGVLV